MAQVTESFELDGVVKRWLILLPEYQLPRANELLRLHWTMRTKHKKALAWMLRYALLEKGRPLVAKKHRRVEIVRFIPHRGREFDDDNLYASVKILLDCLRDEECVVDDSPRYCELQVTQERGDVIFKRGTLIRILERENYVENASEAV